ncbi:MAG: GAF domain-containing protein [Proteobacteria bacterium]|nr:GAF domain-containing protein [Verrucomicrobiota bacterium]NBU08419.1 GAF domain-containing protein [Pseudomonadota bacterium]
MSTELEQLKAKCERLELLNQVGHVIHSTLDAQEALKLILREAVRLMRATSGSVVLVNPTSRFLEIQAAHGLPPDLADFKLPVGLGLTGWVARTGQPACVGDVTKDARYIRLRPEVRSELAVPLLINNDVRGVLNVDADRLNAFTADDQALLEALSLQAARVIQNTWLYEQLRLKARLFESLASVSQTINSTLNLDDALRVITREACQLMDAKMSSLLLLDDSREWLDLRASHGAGSDYLTKPRLNVAESLVGNVVRRRRPIQDENVQTSGRYQNISMARREGLVSLLSVPLVFGGQALGVLNVYRGTPHIFPNEEVRILAALAELSGIAIEKARLYERIVDVEEQLRQNERLSALGLLAAEVAHEIRNPLTVMKMLYHSLDLQFPPGDPRTQDNKIMGEKMEHLNRVVEQVLDFARSTEPRLAPVNVNQLLDDLSLLTRHKLRQQRVEVVRELAPQIPAVLGDATQLEQAFLNLTLNAVEAMPEGGRLTITTRALHQPRTRKEPTHVVIEFSDTGVGMTEEQQQKAFSSLLATTKVKGTGLGLAIVARVIETHRGEVKVKSKPAKGTTFTITLPVG